MKTAHLLMLLALYLMHNGVHSAEDTFKIGTWNTFDVYYGGSREARRNYFFENKDALFGDLDVLCTQESHTYASIADFETNLGDLFPYSYHFDEPSSSNSLIPCSQTEIDYFDVSTSEIYSCNEACSESLPSTLGYVFCLWRCFGDLRNNATGVTTRDNNPPLFDLGRALELSPCLICLWKSYFVDASMGVSWSDTNATSDDMFNDILNACSGGDNTFDYKVNEGMILWLKEEPSSVQYVPLPEAVFIPRGYIDAQVTVAGNPMHVICTHLETPTIDAYFAGRFTTMIQDNIDAGVSELSDITQRDVDQLIADISALEGDVVLLGDLNIGINSRVDMYDALLSGAGLSSVFGTNAELSAAIHCSRCETNPLTSNQEIVDHILTKGAVSDYVDTAERFLDDVYNTSDGMMPLSDHYGIKVTLSVSIATTQAPIVSTAEPVTTNGTGSVESADDSAYVQYVMVSSVFVAFVCVHVY